MEQNSSEVPGRCAGPGRSWYEAKHSVKKEAEHVTEKSVISSENGLNFGPTGIKKCRNHSISLFEEPAYQLISKAIISQQHSKARAIMSELCQQHSQHQLLCLPCTGTPMGVGHTGYCSCGCFYLVAALSLIMFE
jgi:hypothetical protein